MLFDDHKAKRVVVATLRGVGGGAPVAIVQWRQTSTRYIEHGGMAPMQADFNKPRGRTELLRQTEHMFRAFAMQAPNNFAACLGSCYDLPEPRQAFEFADQGVLGGALKTKDRRQPWHQALIALPEKAQSAQRISLARGIAKGLAILHGEVPNHMNTTFAMCDFKADQYAIASVPGACLGLASRRPEEHCLTAKLIDLDFGLLSSEFSACGDISMRRVPPEGLKPYQDLKGEYSVSAQQRLVNYQLPAVLASVFKVPTGHDEAGQPNKFLPLGPAETALRQRLVAGLQHQSPSKRWNALRAWEELNRAAASMFGATPELPSWQTHGELAAQRAALIDPAWPSCDSSCDPTDAPPEPCSAGVRWTESCRSQWANVQHPPLICEVDPDESKGR